MQLQHVNVKLLVQNPEETNLEPLIPVFHSWIENQEGDELLIDVADYTHVPAGPGIVLIGHEGNYSLDNSGNRLGVRYNRKAAFDGGNQECLTQAALAALTACQRLESEPSLGGLFRFNGQDIEFFINDRLIAPNDAATRESFDSDFHLFSQKLFRGKEYSISYGTDPRSLFTAYVRRARPLFRRRIAGSDSPERGSNLHGGRNSNGKIDSNFESKNFHREPGKSKIKRAEIEGFPGAVRMGIHGGIAEYFKLSPEEPMASTLDYIVAAVGGCMTGTVAGALEARGVSADPDNLQVEAEGHIENVDGKMILTGIKLHYRLKVPKEKRATVERALEHHEGLCAASESVRRGITVEWDSEIVEETDAETVLTPAATTAACP